MVGGTELTVADDDDDEVGGAIDDDGDGCTDDWCGFLVLLVACSRDREFMRVEILKSYWGEIGLEGTGWSLRSNKS